MEGPSLKTWRYNNGMEKKPRKRLDRGFMIEYSIKIKDEANTVTVRDIEPSAFLLCKDNALLSEKIGEALIKFGFDLTNDSPEITIKAKMVWQF